MLKNFINKIYKIFNLPRFSEPPKIKLPKFNLPEIVPTEDTKKMAQKLITEESLKNVKIIVGGKEFKRK